MPNTVNRSSFCERFSQLFAMQESLNQNFDCKRWAEKRHPWHYYIRHEAGEAIGHHNEVFHYRGCAPDRKKIETELVDILHFLVAWMLQENYRPAFLDIEQAPLPPIPSEALSSEEKRAHHYEEDLAQACLNQDLEQVEQAFYLFAARLGFSMDYLINQYQLKYTLNQFRIDHGYLDGTYQKIWSGREDNDHLAELAEECRTNEGYDLKGIRNGLALRYAEVK